MQEFSKHSAYAWVAAVEASGTASADELDAAKAASLAHFAPDVAAD